MKHRFLRLFGFLGLAICLLGAVLYAPTASAQTLVTGAVSGVITDPAGATVPAALVTLKSVETGQSYTATTDNSGSYTIPLVKPGQYTITVEKQGFRKTSQTFAVGVGQIVSASYKVEIGEATQVVEVTAALPLLQAENANLATTFSQNEVDKLPNPGNDLTAVAQTAPGVTMNTSSGGGYGNFTAFGLPATANLFTVNGNDEMDPYLNLNNSGATNLLLGTNEVQEVAVVSNGYTGQYGRQAGAQIDYVTKSGANAFHGNAVYWWNGSAMNANDWFNNSTSTPRPFVNNNQWAASIGGPVKKDKAFFFVDTEGLRYILASSNLTIVPTSAFATAVVANLPSFGVAKSVPFYQNIFNLYAKAPGINRAVPVDSSIDGTNNLGCGDLNTVDGSGGVVPGFAQFGGANGTANSAYTMNLGGGTPCAQFFRSTVGQLSREWILAGKFDYNFNDKNHFNIRYRMDRGLQPTNTDAISPIFNATSDQPAYEGQINYTRVISPSMFNQFILSGSWYSAIFGTESTAAQATFPGALYDFDTSSWANIGGINNVFPQGRKVTQYQFVDDLSMTRGAHTIKFGGNFRRNDISDFSPLVRTVPRLRVFSRTDFVEGIIDQISQRFPSRNANPVAIYSFGLYFQDEWRARKDLKFTLTLRGDRNSNAVCQANCFARTYTPFPLVNHDPTVPFNQLYVGGLHSAFNNVEKAVFQPRFGFAWQPGRLHNTVLRGGVGLFSDLYPATLIDNYMRNAPQLKTFTLSFLGTPLSPAEAGNGYASETVCNGIFNTNFNSGGTVATYRAAAAAAGLRCTVPDNNSVVDKINNPKFVEWNFEVQHTFNSKTLLSVNYVGNRGYDIFVNNPYANARRFGTFAGLPAAAPDTRISNVALLYNGGISNYNGLTLSVAHRFTAGFSGRFNYSYSHALDNISNGGVDPYSLNDSLQTQLNPNNLNSLNYSNADYDVRHLISANYVWDLPLKPSNALLNEAIGGWSLSGTVFWRSGYPFSILDAAAPSTILGNAVNATLLVDPTTAVPSECTSPVKACYSSSSFPGVASETGFARRPRNSYRGPHYFNSDFSLTKKFRLTEHANFGVGANFYNVFNHPNFANPVGDISSGQFGTIQSTVVPPTSPYGAFVGSAVSGRLVQLTARVTF